VRNVFEEKGRHLWDGPCKGLYLAAFFTKPHGGDGDKEQPNGLDANIMQITKDVLTEFIAPQFRDTVRSTLVDYMAGQGYFANEFLKGLLRGEDKFPCITWWQLVATQAPQPIRAFANAVIMLQSFPCSAASVERVNSCLGWLHSCRRANLGDDHLLAMAFIRMNRHVSK
jgi:hypothetical protein